MQSDNARAAMFMVGGMAAFLINDTLMKLILDDLPLFQSLFLRGIVTTAIFYAIARHRGDLRLDLPRRHAGLVLLRVLGDVGATFFFITALVHMPLANLTAILQALPLTVTLAAAVFLREPVGWRRMAAICVGFTGVLLIVRPGTEGFDVYSVMAIGSVLCATLRDLFTRSIPVSVPSLAIAFYTSLGVVVLATLGTLSEEWVMPSALNAAWLAGASVFVLLGYLFIIMAMRIGELSFVSPFRYTGLVWALVLGYVVFGHWPVPLTLLGAALIVATGLFTLYREQRVARRRAALAAQAGPR